MPRRSKDFYRGISFQPPAAVAAAARRALDRRAQQPPSHRGMTPVGLARAPQLANRQELSPATTGSNESQSLGSRPNRTKPTAIRLGQENQRSDNTQPSKGEKAAQKKSSILLMIFTSKSSSCKCS